ncbi:MAG TPA: hypothetical protein VFX50_00210, partial [Gemmatimonadales bacterium]|nr:hypothetical protein [Gemmatimonadales bacterium]
MARWVEQQRIVATTGVATHGFGEAVALDGDTALIGAPASDDGATAAGAAYVFVRTTEGWVEQQRLAAAPPTFTARFGHAVALGAGVAVVAAPTNSLGSGNVYVYQRTGATWILEQVLVAADARFFGKALAMDGDTLLVGAQDAAAPVGVVFVFERDGSGFQRIQRLDSLALDEGFGDALAMSGDRALVG